MSKMTATILIILGIILFITGVIMYAKAPEKLKVPDTSKLAFTVDAAIADGVLTKNEKTSIRKIATDELLDPDQAILDAELKMAGLNIKPETEVIDQNKKSGNDFEKFIVQKFDKKYYIIKNWAGDKYVNGRFAETTPQPDLLIELKQKEGNKLFAVECKWRKNERNESFEFASNEQLDRYRKYETEHKIPVFVAIGMGGEGSDPKQLFIIPLKRLKYNKISIDYLKQFEMQIDKEFFFDKEQGILR
jgi:hypothetical protein